MKILVAITGASGILYATRLLEALQELDLDYDGVISHGAKRMFSIEAKDKLHLVESFYGEEEIEAPFSSGSSRLDSMTVIPCSMKTLAAIANGYANNLIARSADVVLKEGRKLVLVPRETPLNPIQLENMLRLSKLGATILPAMPGFYHSPQSIEDILDFIAGKVLDSLEIENKLYRRWGE